MILQRLAEHYDRIAASGDEDNQLAPPGFSRQKISFCIVLEPDGRLNQIKSESVQKGTDPSSACNSISMRVFAASSNLPPVANVSTSETGE
jgi:hypothetical protein